jgi:hypothetical protein
MTASFEAPRLRLAKVTPAGRAAVELMNAWIASPAAPPEERELVSAHFDFFAPLPSDEAVRESARKLARLAKARGFARLAEKARELSRA